MKFSLNQIIIALVILLLFLISITTRYYGHTDVGDYSDTAKFFAGKYDAKLRSSHSILYGLIFSPLLMFVDSFILLKILSVIFISLIILSIYYISNKNNKTLLLFLFTPIIYYLSPWISPIPLACLCFLWGWFFLCKYDKNKSIKYLLFSGILLSLAWSFWDPLIYFIFIISIIFLYNHKLINIFYFLIGIMIGILPKLITDYVLFSFPLFGIIRYFFGIIAFYLYGGIYQNFTRFSLANIILFVLILPFYSFLLFKKKIFIKNKKTILFILLSFLIMLSNPQIRYILLICPMIIIILGENLSNKQYKIQLLVFIVISLIVINPYLIQIKYQTNGKEFNSFIKNLPNLKFSNLFDEDLISQDLISISNEYPNQTFVVGNLPDDYQTLSHLYWGNNVKEFVSIQDYQLFFENKREIASKSLCSQSKISDRREICVKISMNTNSNDKTDYYSIKYAISLNNSLDLQDFKLIKKYDFLYLYGKNKE